LTVALASPARADDATPSAAPASSPPPADAVQGAPTGPNPATGIPIAGYIVSPSLFAGVIYDDNAYPTADDRKALLGFVLAPNITAVDDQGLHKTTLTLNADAELYPNNTGPSSSAPSPSNVSAVASIDHVWKPTQDLTIEAVAGFTRQYGLFGSLLAAGQNFVSSPTLGAVTGYQQFSDQFNGSVTVEKKFNDQWFLRGGFGASDTEYDSAPVGVAGALGGADYNAFLRAGFNVTPQVAAFVETGADLHRYGDGWYDSNAYRLIGGLSSDQIGLFKGEIYAGYQKEFSAEGTFGAVAAPTYGAKLYYYPTRYLTLAASLDQSFGSAAVQTPTPTGAPAGDTVQARFQADYSLAQYWTASFRAGYAQTTYSDNPLVQSEWTIGGGVNYNFWRNIALTMNYQYTATAANLATTPGYRQDLVSAGMTYRY
jgi:hypothetical protein